MAKSVKLASVGLASLALAFSAGSVSAEDAGVYHVKPMQGMVLAVGSKRAISYYTADAGKRCDLTVVVAESMADGVEAKTTAEPVRVKMAVNAGTSARVDSLGGSLEFACTADARELTITPAQHVAYNAAK